AGWGSECRHCVPWVRRWSVEAGGHGRMEAACGSRLFGGSGFGVTLQCPLHVLADQFGRMLAASLQCLRDAGRRCGVAERHGDVAQPALMAAAADRAAFGATQEFV